jgi:hypothetical protein
MFTDFPRTGNPAEFLGNEVEIQPVNPDIQRGRAAGDTAKPKSIPYGSVSGDEDVVTFWAYVVADSVMVGTRFRAAFDSGNYEFIAKALIVRFLLPLEYGMLIVPEFVETGTIYGIELEQIYARFVQADPDSISDSTRQAVQVAFSAIELVRKILEWYPALRDVKEE